jgi:hypothetical protein
MNLKRLSLAAIPAIGLGLMPAAALAQSIETTTTFNGEVPGSCTYTTGEEQTVDMNYTTADNGTLTGTSQDIGINCNFVTSVTLGAVNEVDVAVSTDNTAELLVNDVALVTSDNSSPSDQTSLGNTGGVTTNVKVRLTSTGASAQGDYQYTVLLTTLSS